MQLYLIYYHFWYCTFHFIFFFIPECWFILNTLTFKQTSSDWLSMTKLTLVSLSHPQHREMLLGHAIEMWRKSGIHKTRACSAVGASTLKLHKINTTFNILCLSLQEDISVAKHDLPMATLKVEAHSAA